MVQLYFRVSMINVFLLSRCTAHVRKAVVIFLLIVFLMFGIWYCFPFSDSSHSQEFVSRSPPVKHTEEPLRTDLLGSLHHFDLKMEKSSLYERETNLMRDIELLKLESDRQKIRSEMLQAEMSFMKERMKNVETEHVQQISELKSSLSNLQSASDVLKERVDKQDALNTNLKAELSDWLVRHLKDPSLLESTVVLHPVLQRVLEDLEKQIIAKDVKEIIHRAISLYRADGIGMADYALESSGASVINTRCSVTYNTRSACLSVFGIPLWYQSESPRTVIQPELYPGKCWAFRGSQGFLVISLSYPVRITHVSLEHLSKELSPTGRIDSSPKDFAVYGMADENEDGKLLAMFTYDQDGEPIQTFKLPETSDIYSLVELRILSNWGHLEYTCVYRFRVHGEPMLG